MKITKSRFGSTIPALALGLGAVCGLTCCPIAGVAQEETPEVQKADLAPKSDLQPDLKPVVDDPQGRAIYERMRDAIEKADSLSFACQYTRESKGQFRISCRYSMWLKKPNFFRMEVKSDKVNQHGVLIGDGSQLWIYWPTGRPQWSLVNETQADKLTRFTSYMTKPTPQGEHSIWHEAIFLSNEMGFPIMDMSEFHGHRDSINPFLDAVQIIGSEVIDGQECDVIEISWMDGQRRWEIWVAKKDSLPRKLYERTRVTYDIETTELWTDLKQNEEIADSKFQWSPPKDWTQWQLPDDSAVQPQPGTLAPDFELESIDGGRLRLSSLRGKAVWLCFWRVGCPPCRIETPVLQELHDKYGDKLTILGVNVSDDRAITLKFLEDYGVTYANILDISDEAQTVCADAYGGGAVPLNYLIDPQGVIVSTNFDFLNAKEELKKVGLEIE